MNYSVIVSKLFYHVLYGVLIVNYICFFFVENKYDIDKGFIDPLNNLFTIMIYLILYKITQNKIIFLNLKIT